ncbi:T9SS type A sorting domain-containing protein [Botryobacter ruber]|uniref:T9SS type A sorting domain-containing protein n=1 Tax=Botryobacter ruber TaxID=2171629 RepID=UPI0013E3A204|nr:T9SS type A sorting domain-containing protein [Botryobacter ruber]
MKKNVLVLLIAFMTGFQFAATAVDHTIQVADFQYNPSTLNINVGDRVIWQWQSGDHPTQSDSSPAAWATFPINTESRTFTHTFTAAGTYPYHCQLHGTPTSGMRGTITVSSVTGIKQEKGMAAVMEVYPNPARENVMVKLDVFSSKTYTLTLTNMIGQTVSVVTDTDFPAGSEEAVVLDVKSLPSGIYFLRLLANDKIMDTRRLILKK